MELTASLCPNTAAAQSDIVDPFELAYVEANDTVRGCTLPGSVVIDNYFAVGDLKSSNCSTWSPQSAKSGIPSVEFHIASDQKASFADSDFLGVICPPDVPFGGLACTSVSLRHVSAGDALQVIHFFLASQSGATVTEVCLEECSIMADIVLGPDQFLAQCTMAVRIFKTPLLSQDSDDTEQVMVEFRRESGDAFAFVQMFNAAQSRLQAFADGEPSDQCGELLKRSYSVDMLRVSCAPEVPFGGIASTSVPLRHASAGNVMETIHSFLRSQSGATVKEVCYEDCSLLVDVVLDADGWSSQCIMAVRIFTLPLSAGQPEEAPQLTVEFRRDDGDTFAFVHMFNQAQAWLHRFAVEGPGSHAGTLPSQQVDKIQPPLWEAEHGCTVTADDLNPLLDVLGNKTLSGQSIAEEALIGLAIIAQSSLYAASTADAARSHLQGLQFRGMLL